MFDVPAVIELAGGVLNKKEVHTIMDNYTNLKSKFASSKINGIKTSMPPAGAGTPSK